MRVKRRQVAAVMVTATMAVGIVGASPASAGDRSSHQPPCEDCHEGDGPTVVWQPPNVRANPPKDPPTRDPEPDPPLESDCIDADGDGENDDDCQTVENGFWNGDGNGDGGYGGSMTGPIIQQ